jgi:lipoate-protein ligase B
VDNDLEPFSWVVACGLPEVEMTSVAAELGGGASIERFRARMATSFCQAHDRRPRLATAQDLGIDATHAAELAAA